MENIVEYTRKLPFQPEQTMHKVKFGNREYHSNKYEQAEEWLTYQKLNEVNAKQDELIRDKAITSFFKDTTTSKD